MIRLYNLMSIALTAIDMGYDCTKDTVAKRGFD